MFKKATRSKVFLKLAITGSSGTGKTTAALRLGTSLAQGGKVAFIDTENGSASLYSDRFDFDVINLDPPFDHDKFVDPVIEAVEQGYKVIVIDSFTHFWQEILDYKSKLDARGGNQYTNWKPATDRFRKVIDTVLHSPIHVICCMRSKSEYVLSEEKGKQAPKKVGMAPIMRDGIEYEFTTVFDLEMDHTAKVSKDRTNQFDGKIFEVTKKTGETFIQWLNAGAALAPEPDPFIDSPEALPPAKKEPEPFVAEGLLTDYEERSEKDQNGSVARTFYGAKLGDYTLWTLEAHLGKRLSEFKNQHVKASVFPSLNAKKPRLVKLVGIGLNGVGSRAKAKAEHEKGNALDPVYTDEDVSALCKRMEKDGLSEASLLAVVREMDWDKAEAGSLWALPVSVLHLIDTHWLSVAGRAIDLENGVETPEPKPAEAPEPVEVGVEE